MQIGLDNISLADRCAFSKMTPDNKSLQLSPKALSLTVGSSSVELWVLGFVRRGN
jgi:hypothetical protein